MNTLHFRKDTIYEQIEMQIKEALSPSEGAVTNVENVRSTMKNEKATSYMGRRQLLRSD